MFTSTAFEDIIGNEGAIIYATDLMNTISLEQISISHLKSKVKGAILIKGLAV